jgi:prolipoprotein diacylglyceryltransferase
VEPVRVKVYGVVFVVLIGAGWWFGWPPLRDRLTRVETPASAFRDLLVAVLNNVPWILLAVLVYKIIEVFLVLRAFARHTNPKRERGI